MDDYSQVRYWVDELPKKGKTTFSLAEAEIQFQSKPASSVSRALARLSESGKIFSVWKGFYAIALPEYGLVGTVPPMDYISQLMCYLNTDYYIALLTAASYQGASHHAPQVLYVICNKDLREKSKYKTKIEPAYKKSIQLNYISKINTRTASVNISNPELTAVDLLAYVKRAGGINQVTTVLAELVESINFDDVNEDFFYSVPAAYIQRLGYLLEVELEEKEISESLYEKAMRSGVSFHTTTLVVDKGNQLEVLGRNKKWRLIVNYRIESDL